MAKQKSIPLSKEAKAAGVQWLHVSGASTAKEARKMEKLFVADLEKIKKLRHR